MPVWVWVSLGVFVVALAGATGAAVVRVVGLLRALHRFGHGLEALAKELEASQEGLRQASARLADEQARARTSVTRLRASLARLRVLLDSLQEVRLGIAIARLLLARR